ncbi:Hcp family type VI secretion system effector [Pseudomonas sp. NPDC089401]|uniref:Hcp family type VI secretion system effector n=1 Tax=Pseudomonas sp. NPDC089401 TaxID=3364462 RepID=UPI003819F4E4
MAINGYLTINGELQGQISAGCSGEASIGNRCQTPHQDQIMVLGFRHGQGDRNGGPRSIHQPVVVNKLVDKATPLLGQAADGRERVECDFEFYRTHSSGQREKYFSVRLEGAVILEQEMVLPHTVLMSDQAMEERLYISYRTISWIHHAAGTTGHASWKEQP